MENQQKCIFIVGGASGIGKATVLKLLSLSCRIIVADKNAAALEKFKGEMTNEQKRVEWLVMDIASSDSVQQGLSWVKDHVGKLDATVISAGIHSTCPVDYLSDETIFQVIDVNLMAHIKLVRDVLPLLKEGGRIVGVSSIAAGLGVPMSSLYSASKAGLEGFYESLSAEVSYRKLQCVVIHPGNVNTGFNETGNHFKKCGQPAVDEGYKRVVEKIDSRFGINPSQVAKVIAYALGTPSPRFCYVVGSNAKKAYWAKRILGRDLALKLMAKHFGF